MKKIYRSALAALCLSMTLVGGAYAVPSLQLDILGGTYDMSTETIVSASDSFTLFAYLDTNRFNTLGDTYTISAALVPQTPYTPGGLELGSFSINGSTVDVTNDMQYGIPPIETYLARDRGDLPSHDIYSTYFMETSFSFTPAQQTTIYDTQLLTGRGPEAGTGMYYVAFNIDASTLTEGYQLHFDLYNTTVQGTDVDVNNLFAPFSHDAESTSHVPEPGTIMLLGSGLAGLALYRFRFRS